MADSAPSTAGEGGAAADASLEEDMAAFFGRYVCARAAQGHRAARMRTDPRLCAALSCVRTRAPGAPARPRSRASPPPAPPRPCRPVLAWHRALSGRRRGAGAAASQQRRASLTLMPPPLRAAAVPPKCSALRSPAVLACLWRPARALRLRICGAPLTLSPPLPAPAHTLPLSLSPTPGHTGTHASIAARTRVP